MNPFTTALVKAPKRSRFDFDHSNTFGTRVGVLTPSLTEFIVPGDEVAMSMEQICRLAPMPVPTFVPLKVRHDFFFVPLRLLYGNDPLDKLFGSESAGRIRASVPSLANLFGLFSDIAPTTDAMAWELMETERINYSLPLPGSLFDYLGYPVFTDRNGAISSEGLGFAYSGDFGAFADSIDENPYSLNSATNTGRVLVEKIFAYHFIWRDWYRFTGIQNNQISENFLDNGVLSLWQDSPLSDASVSHDEYDANTDLKEIPQFAPFVQGVGMKLGDLSPLKLAHLTKDMFMSARYGNKPTVLIPTGNNGTIPALREASAVQRFLDLISITGQRYFDKVRGLFGVEPEGPKDDRVQFLARYQQFIKVGEVITTATTDNAQTGDYAGRGILIDGKYLFKRRFTEHGYLFCITSIIPDVAYNGLGRDLTDVNVLDTPVPSLAEVGDQSILTREVAFKFGHNYAMNDSSFGDQFRYYAYKSHNNEVHGFFLTDTARPWSDLLPDDLGMSNVIGSSRVYPQSWNYLFNDTSDGYVFGDRFFFSLDFYEKITRALPKYINYHL